MIMKMENIMKIKIFFYIISSFFVIWSMEAVNINQIFKKNKEEKARVFYFLLGLSMIQLVTTFLFDLYMSMV